MSKAKKELNPEREVTEVELASDGEVWCARAPLPPGIQWAEIAHQQITTATGEVAEPWLDVRAVSADALHRALSDYGVSGPIQVVATIGWTSKSERLRGNRWMKTNRLSSVAP